MSDLPNVTYNEARHQLKLDGQPIPTGTAISGMLDKPGLPFGASKECALFAVYHRDEWLDLPEEEAYHKLRRHHAGVWSEKAARGTSVHALAMQWAQGKEIDVPAELEPYIDALEAFYRDYDPEWVEVERNILHLEPGLEYGGQLDYIRRYRKDQLVLGDIKTGKRYPVDTAIQMSGYRFAQHLATYEQNQLVRLDPMPLIDACEVLYLHDDGTYECLEIPADVDAYAVFLRLRATWSWKREMERWEKANPEPERQGAVA